jgi:hypothetical protein
MALATGSRANQVADEIVELLAKINSARDASAWRTSPRTVKRGLLVGDLTLGSRPLLAVQVLDWEDTRPWATGHLGTIHIGVHIIVDGKDAEVQLNEVARDVVRAIAVNESLGEVVASIYPQRYEPQQEAMERAGAGLGIATVVFEAVYDWKHMEGA